MLKDKFKRKSSTFVNRKSQTVPNQSMTIKDIVERFLRGLPVDVNIKQGVYHPENNDHDYNKMSNLDTVDKAYLATEMREKNEQISREIEANERAKAEEKKAKDEAELSELKARAQQTGIEYLDNTMPDDTGTDSQAVTRGRNKKS